MEESTISIALFTVLQTQSTFPPSFMVSSICVHAFSDDDFSSIKFVVSKIILDGTGELSVFLDFYHPSDYTFHAFLTLLK